MMNEIDVLRDVCDRLTRAEIPYMLTGSQALNFYAQPRMTRDIDIVIELDPGDAQLISDVFESDYYVPRELVKRAIAARKLFNILHAGAIVKVDFIPRKEDEYRRVEFGRRQEVDLGEMKIWIVSKEDLIISKLDWAKESHSDFQLRDVRNLLQTGYDEAYLREWTAALHLNALLNECLSDE